MKDIFKVNKQRESKMLKNLIEESLKESIKEMLTGEKEKAIGESFYKTGNDYVVRTVTMIYLGEIKSEAEDHLVLTDCAWIPDTSRWNEFLKGKKPSEMEPYQNDVIIYKSAILDATEMTKKVKREVI